MPFIVRTDIHAFIVRTDILVDAETENEARTAALASIDCIVSGIDKVLQGDIVEARNFSIEVDSDQIESIEKRHRTLEDDELDLRQIFDKDEMRKASTQQPRVEDRHFSTDIQAPFYNWIAHSPNVFVTFSVGALVVVRRNDRTHALGISTDFDWRFNSHNLNAISHYIVLPKLPSIDRT